jgi:4-hydroxy-3-methylbut-2-enyl diphosphate reductase
MKVKLAKNYGFCFGVKRAIEIAQQHKNSATMGPLIHNQKEISRLKRNFNVDLYDTISQVKQNETVIIRTHGITKNDLQTLKQHKAKVINATCPFVTTPQQIVKNMSNENYSIIIFGDEEHPEVKGVKSYGDDVYVISTVDEISKLDLKYDKVATVAQTTKQKEQYADIISNLMIKYKEVRVFNTICDATFENQAAADELSLEVDIMIVIGGKNSSNTKQLFYICEKNTVTYHIEDEQELDISWFKDKKICGVTAGASTPDWIIKKVCSAIEVY